MILAHIITQVFFYSILVTGYLLLMMVTISPRVWGYNDYPQEIKDKVPPQTRAEKRLAIIVSIPWFIIAFGFPIYSTIMLKAKLFGEISVLIAFFNLLAMFILATIGDLLILDWLIVSKITPQFVIIPGTEKGDYKDFSYHYKGHARAAVVTIPILLIIAAIISYI